MSAAAAVEQAQRRTWIFAADYPFVRRVCEVTGTQATRCIKPRTGSTAGSQ